jgi:hypothetical protein
MPAPDPGHGGARLKPVPSPHFPRQGPTAPLQSRCDTTPSVAPMATSLPSRKTRSARQPPRRRQIPIDRTARTAAPDPPAVSSPEACPTPADQARRRHPDTAGVRQPLTTCEVGDCARNVACWGKSGRTDGMVGTSLISRGCRRSRFVSGFLVSAYSKSGHFFRRLSFC